MAGFLVGVGLLRASFWVWVIVGGFVVHTVSVCCTGRSCFFGLLGFVLVGVYGSGVWFSGLVGFSRLTCFWVLVCLGCACVWVGCCWHSFRFEYVCWLC